MRATLRAVFADLRKPRPTPVAPWLFFDDTRCFNSVFCAPKDNCLLWRDDVTDCMNKHD